MTLPASLTPPLGLVNQPQVLSADGSRKRPADAELAVAVKPVPAAQGLRDRDSSQFREVSSWSRAPGGDMPASDDRASSALAESEKIETPLVAQKSEVLSLRRALDIRARSEVAEPVELPVPVTEILLVSLGNAASNPVAGINAKSLYESMRAIFSPDAPSPFHQVDAGLTLQAA